MINIENIVYTAVRTAVLTVDENIYVTGAYSPKIEKLPCVYFHLTDSSVVENSIDSTQIDYAQRVVFTVEVYTDYKNNKKVAAKDIFNAVDTAMTNMGFIRTFYSPTPNMDDTIQRILGRFKGAVTYEETNSKFRVYQE